jgi:hypothetical protein
MGTDGRTVGKAGSPTGKDRPRIRVESGGFGVETETTGVGESSPKGAKSERELRRDDGGGKLVLRRILTPFRLQRQPTLVCA